MLLTAALRNEAGWIWNRSIAGVDADRTTIERGVLRLLGLLRRYPAVEGSRGPYLAEMAASDMRVLARVAAVRYLSWLASEDIGDDDLAYIYASMVNETRLLGNGDPWGGRFGEAELIKAVEDSVNDPALASLAANFLVMTQRALRYAEPNAR